MKYKLGTSSCEAGDDPLSPACLAIAMYLVLSIIFTNLIID